MTMTILPGKHVSLSKSALGVGAVLLDYLVDECTVSTLWEHVRKKPEILTFERFIIGLDVLFALGLVTYNKYGLLEASKK